MRRREFIVGIGAIALAGGVRAADSYPAKPIRWLVGFAAGGAADVVVRLVAEEDGPAARALELVVVTARLEPALVDRLIQRALARRQVSIVFVDPASFNGAARRAEPALLRLQAAGIPVAVVRVGDDLAAALSGRPTTARAHA